MVGDTATGALVAADGTVDWYCPGRFDAPAALFRLLDRAGGAVRVGPAATSRSSRAAMGQQAYDRGTNLLRTVLQAPDGDIEVLDFMPWSADPVLRPERVVRVVTARRGPVDVEVDVMPGSAFGPPRRVLGWSEGLAFDQLLVRSGFELSGAGHGRRGQVRLEAGERMVVTIDAADSRHHGLSPDAALTLADQTADAWRRHVRDLRDEGPYRQAVERSLLTLKMLTSASTGALVAAATTSLPERVGGERNWDHRYAWVRDASAAIDATAGAGLTEEAERFAEWLALVLKDAEFPLQPFSAVDGEPVGAERELAGLAGWRHSQPVREGNGAASQLQLDFPADLVDTLSAQADGRGPLLERWDDLARLADWLAETWREPDHGIWELRSEPRQLVSSKAACWYALDRMSRLAARRNPLDLSQVAWRTAADEVAAWLDEHATSPGGGCRQDDSGDAPDASLLRLAWRGPWPPDHRNVVGTVDRVLRQLSSGPHVYRYPSSTEDGLPPGEGASVACGFWAVRALAAVGRWDEAHERMEALVGFAGPLGLLPEQADPLTGDFLGNLPQALSHLSLIQAARALAAGPR